RGWARAACFVSLTVPRNSTEAQEEIVGRQWHDGGGAQARFLRERIEIVNVTHAPFGVLGAQARVECGIARGGVRAAALERPVDEKLAALAQESPGAGEQILRYRPQRNVQHIDAQQARQRSVGAVVTHPGSVRIEEVDALWRAQ